MQFTINLATRTYLDHRLIKRICIAIVVLLALMLFWTISRVFSNQGELQRLKSDIAAYEGRLNSRPKDVPEKEYNRLLATIGFYNGVIERKVFNWLDLLGQVENATPEGIALVSLVRDKKSGDIKIEGRANSFANIRSYMEKLYGSRSFANILLLSHHDLVTSANVHGVQFTISYRTALK